MSIILFLAVLVVLILVHEWGHFIVAKKTGMRVDEFGIGFPPRLWSTIKGETRYSLNALPIGGYVKIHGEDGLTEDISVDADRTFAAQPRLAQAAVLIAGVAMNVLLAWALIFIVMMVGVPTSVTPEEASPDASLIISSILPDSPAAAAGITPGSEVVAAQIGSETLSDRTPEAFGAFVSDAASAPVQLTLVDGDDVREVVVTPALTETPDGVERPLIGVSLALIDTVRLGPVAALWAATERTGALLVAITVGLGTLITDAIIGQADLEAVTGPVGIVGMVGDAASFGLTSLLLFTAVISLNLAIINLLPIPALDGGRLVMVAIEGIRGKALNPEWAARANFVGFVFLMGLMVVVTWNDIARLL